MLHLFIYTHVCQHTSHCHAARHRCVKSMCAQQGQRHKCEVNHAVWSKFPTKREMHDAALSVKILYRTYQTSTRVIHDGVPSVKTLYRTYQTSSREMHDAVPSVKTLYRTFQPLAERCMKQYHW